MRRIIQFLFLAFCVGLAVPSLAQESKPAHAEAQPVAAGAIDLRIPVEGESRQLAATLYVPAGGGPFPTLITAPGANSASRNMAGWKAFSDRLAGIGFALLVYDQPGTGDTPGKWVEGAPLRTTVDELKSVAAFLANHPKVRPDRIGTIGWSRGGWTGPWAAVESPHIRFVIANSAPSVTPNEANIHQRGEELIDQGVSRHDVEAINALREIVWTYYGTGINHTQASAAWKAAASQPWFAKIGSSRLDVASPEEIKSADFAYFREGTFDPAPILAKLNKPVLVMLGSADRHIPINESIAGWRNAFASSANSDATLVVLANAGHALKLVDGKERMSAVEGHAAAFAKLKDHPQYIPTLLDWLRRQL